MYQAFVFVILCGLVLAATSRVDEQRAAAVEPSASALAQDFSVYRTAVIRYVQTHPDPGFAGSVPNANLPAVGVYVPNPRWSNYVNGSTVVVYAPSVPVPNFVGPLEEIAQDSVFAGAVYNGTVVASPTATMPSGVALPAAVTSAAPNGAPVWEALDVF